MLLIAQDHFNRADTTPSPNPGSIGNGWTDYLGSKWSISGSKAVSLGGNMPFAVLLRPASEVAEQCRIVFEATVDASDGYVYGVLRYNESTASFVRAMVHPGQNGQSYIQRYEGAAQTAQQAVLIAPASFAVGHTVRVDFSCAPIAGGTRFSLTVTDLDSGGSTSNSLDVLATDSANVQHAAGLRRAGLSAINGSLRYDNFALYDAAISPMTVGTLTFATATRATVSLAYSGTSGGSGAVTHQWHRGLTPDFAPSPTTLIAGATGLSLADSPPDRRLYYYKVVATDQTTATVTSNVTAAKRGLPPLRVGFIGASLMELDPGNGTSVDWCRQFLEAYGGWRDVQVVNRSASGANTAWFLPSEQRFADAIAAFHAANVSWVLVAIGTNDAYISRTPDSYEENIAQIVQALVAEGFRVMLASPGYRHSVGSSSITEAQMALVPQYMDRLARLHDGIDMFWAGRDSYDYFAMTRTTEFWDAVHVNDEGAMHLGMFWGRAIADAEAGEELERSLESLATQLAGVVDDVHAVRAKTDAIVVTDGKVEATTSLTIDAAAIGASVWGAPQRTLTGGAVVVVRPIQAKTIHLVQGDSYLASDGTAMMIEKAAGAAWPVDLGGWTIAFTARPSADTVTRAPSYEGQTITGAGAVVEATGSSQRVRVDLPAASTAGMAPGPAAYRYDVQASLGDARRTLQSGTLTVIPQTTTT